MARLPKQGLDYFPMDTEIDVKVKLIESEFGLVGFGVLVKLWQEIYKGEGYFFRCDEDFLIIFAYENKIDVDFMHTFIEKCITRNLFDRDLWEQQSVLTSVGIQKRFFSAAVRRKKTEVIEEFLLLKKDDLLVNANIILINACNNSINDDRSTQRRGEERKGEERKGYPDARAKKSEPDSEKKDLPSDTDTAAIISEFEKCGFQINARIGDEATDLLSSYPADWILEAIRRATDQGKKSLAYIRGILRGFDAAGCIDSPAKNKRVRPPNKAAPVDDGIDWGELTPEKLKAWEEENNGM